MDTHTTHNRNKELARIFSHMAGCYRYLGPEERFRAIAYDTASKTLSNLQEPIEILATDFKKLDELKGVGESIGEKIIEYLQTGQIQTFEKLKKKVPFALLELLDIEGVGPSTLHILHDKLKIDSKEELVKVLEEGKLESVKGFATKKIDNLKRGLKIESVKQRMPLKIAQKIGKDILNQIRNIPGVIRCELAGSLRRKKETIGDIDILIIADEKKWRKIISTITHLTQVEKILAAGKTKASVILKNNKTQVDIRIVHEYEFGAAFFYFTGSKEHNIKLRTMAKQKGWKINEYGVFDEKTGKRIAGRTEEEIYSLFNLKYIPPEQRLGKDELSKARIS